MGEQMTQQQTTQTERRRFNPARGGHAPGHLRDWFGTFVETGELDDEMVEKGLTIDWLYGQLWNCTDVLPNILTSLVEDRVGEELRLYTYGAAVRALKSRSEATR